MRGFVEVAVRDFFLPVLWWSAVFVLFAVAAGIAVAWWALRRVRAASPAGGGPSGVRRWTAAAVVAAGSILIPIVIALVHAAPFAVQLSLVNQFDRSAPAMSDWMVDLAAGQMAVRLGVAEDETAVDVFQMAAKVDAALAALEAEEPPESLWQYLRWMAMKEALRHLRRTVATLKGPVSWRDLIGATKSAMRTQLSWLRDGVVPGLQAGAVASLASAVGLIAASNACAIVAVLLLIPGRRRPDAPVDRRAPL